MSIHHYDQLTVDILSDQAEAGAATAAAFADAARVALADKNEIAVILATGNSQLEFVRALRSRTDIEWSRITVLHMDEYLGMSPEHSASFRRWMHVNVVDALHPRAFEGVGGDASNVQGELERYSTLIETLEPSITVMGIGENGHLAFNDPPADFDTTDLMRVVEMDEVSRKQQVGEGHFPDLESTPTHALTMTIPALLRPSTVLVLAPEARKAPAVQRALEGEVSPESPASILRTQPHARVFLDSDSAALLTLAGK